MHPLKVYSPDELFSGEPPDLAFAAYRFLAEGDSWFTFGSLNPLANSNLLFEMRLRKTACAVNCARPGDTLARMVDMNRDPMLKRLLVGRQARIWDALLLSCGGNDLIDALGVSDPAVPAHLRLLLPSAQWGPASDGAARYLSRAGWQTFDTYLHANFAHLLALRDAGPSAGCPAFIHGYARPTPRDAGAGLGKGPWLLPSMRAHHIPHEHWEALGALLMDELGMLLARISADTLRFPNLHYFDSTSLGVLPAAPGSTGRSGDWLNEIHLTREGYRKIAVPWGEAIEEVLEA